MNGLLLMAIFLSAGAVYALLSDTLIMRGTFKKENHPTIFWLGTLFYAVTGTISFILYLQIPKP
jgi:hypothetical protein